MRILIAVDESEYTDLAVAAVAARPWPPDTEFRLLIALEPYPTMVRELGTLPPNDCVSLEDLMRERAGLFLGRAAEALEAAGIDRKAVTTDIAVGSATEVILEEARRWGADLIVVGSHGYGAVKRLMLGSVSHSVLLHAPCSVEIVRPKAATTIEAGSMRA